jgi:hypothetical protein
MGSSTCRRDLPVLVGVARIDVPDLTKGPAHVLHDLHLFERSVQGIGSRAHGIHHGLARGLGDGPCFLAGSAPTRLRLAHSRWRCASSQRVSRSHPIFGTPTNLAILTSVVHEIPTVSVQAVVHERWGDTGVDGAYAARTANKAYRTTPLRALWQHAPYFHDGSAATLADVVVHYNRIRKLDLTAEQQRELIEYLKWL